MKLLRYVPLIALSLNAFAQSEEIREKLNKIEEDLKKVEAYESEGLKSDTLSRQKEMLLEDRKKYSSLLKTTQKSEKHAAKDKKKNEKKNLERPDKNIPSVVKKDIEKLHHYEDESIPLERRYDLILKEISNIYELNTKIESDSASNSEALTRLRDENKRKLKELERLKNLYEHRINESEAEELSAMKKLGVRVGVMADIYYQWDFNRPQRVNNAGNDSDIPYKNYTTRHNDLSVGLVELNIFKNYKNLDFYADVDFGEMAEQNKSHAVDGVSHHLGQGFLRYNFRGGDGPSVTAGKFYTHFGYEVAKNIENRTYSRPFYFTMVCPFWHEGLSVTQQNIAGHLGYGAYVYDRTDNRPDNNQGKTLGAQLSFSSEKFLASYNGITGPEGNSAEGSTKTLHELILTYKPVEWLDLVVDGIVGETKKFNGGDGKSRYSAIVGYADFTLSRKDKLNLRYEKFNEHVSGTAVNVNGVNENLFNTFGANNYNQSAEAPSIDSYTVTNRYDLGNGSQVRFEYRFDSSDQELFPKHDGAWKKTQATATVGWLYSI